MQFYRIKQFLYVALLVALIFAFTPSLGLLNVLSAILASVTAIVFQSNLFHSVGGLVILLYPSMFGALSNEPKNLWGLTLLINLFTVESELISYLSRTQYRLISYLSRRHDRFTDHKYVHDHFDENELEKKNQELIKKNNLRSPEDVQTIGRGLLKANLLAETIINPFFSAIPDKFQTSDYNVFASLYSGQIFFNAGLLDKNLTDEEVRLILAHEITHLKKGYYEKGLVWLIRILSPVLSALVAAQLFLMLGDSFAFSNKVTKVPPFFRENLKDYFPNDVSFLVALLHVGAIAVDQFTLSYFKNNKVTSILQGFLMPSKLTDFVLSFIKNGHQRGEELRADIGGAEMLCSHGNSVPLDLMQKMDQLITENVKKPDSSWIGFFSDNYNKLYQTVVGEDHPPYQERDEAIKHALHLKQKNKLTFHKRNLHRHYT